MTTNTKQIITLIVIASVILFGIGGCYQFQANRFNKNYGTEFTCFDIAMGIHKQHRGINQ